MISTIRKRDGKLVPYDSYKIANAVFKAAEAVGVDRHRLWRGAPAGAEDADRGGSGPQVLVHQDSGYPLGALGGVVLGVVRGFVGLSGRS